MKNGLHIRDPCAPPLSHSGLCTEQRKNNTEILSLIHILRSGQHGGARPVKGVKDAPARFADLHHIPHKLQGLLRCV